MQTMKLFAAPVCAIALALGACETTTEGDAKAAAEKASSVDMAALQAIVDARSDDDKARDQYRNPAETLAFFGLEPDMTVVETLPGRNWYSKIIAPYVAEEGRYAAVNYQDGMWPLILPNPTPELIEQVSNWMDDLPEQVGEFADPAQPVLGYEFGDMPAELEGQADMFLFIRALHNFNRAGGDFGAEALNEAYAALKPGGVLGVVQHAAPEGAEGAAADGTTGYMSKANVVAMVEAAGFVLEAESDINANPADQPAANEFVWRLPPTYGLGDQDRDKYAAIGETNRMTLRFRKPAQ